MGSWRPRKSKWPWRDFLTEEEASEVRDLERKQESARYEMMQATMLLNPIRNRAIHRAIHKSKSPPSPPGQQP